MAYLDAWVVDKTMFDYVSQGGCSCCGIASSMLDFATLAEECSDWETDDEEREMFSPWPTFLHEDVQTQRGKIRIRLKQQLQQYAAFWTEHSKPFLNWWNQQPSGVKFRLFQVQDTDVMNYVHTNGDVHGAYRIVLAAAMEQIKNFHQTGYSDARTGPEVYFEKHLQFEKGAFTLSKTYLDEKDDNVGFTALIQQLGGPRLLPSRESNNDEEHGVTAPTENVQVDRTCNIYSFVG
ncbi:hypothetical protein THRCLA_00799 [Thraustotheca clavata]|uniref:Uncharacterized protein n=1 Tax=Thraustotheca clavata TaxID=74557 RepID=A0A1W0AA67_9STRA|nr:hypothetical protein THRCLA_00799 [Thraustotheca clavata]